MRKLILIATLVLMSASAHASETRGLILASNEGPKLTVAEQLKAFGPEQVAKADIKSDAKIDTKVEPKVEAKPEVKTEAKQEPQAQPKPVAKKRETDEQKARRIAARYGISW